MKPNVLVGIMTCNFQDYINLSIQSALAQTYPCDLLVTDDGSRDMSREIIMSYPPYNPIHKLFHYDNSGDELRAISDMIYFSKDYDYLYILSGDDELYPDAIRLLVSHAEEGSFDWVSGGIDCIDEGNNVVNRWTYDGFPESIEDCIAYMWIRRSLPTTFGSLFSAKFLAGKTLSRFPSTTFSLDACTAIDWYTYFPKISRIHTPILKYRYLHPDSRSQLLQGERGVMQEELRDKLVRVFGEEYILACSKHYLEQVRKKLEEL